jgi:RimJ/RimL family protein N-acetyltransferase
VDLRLRHWEEGDADALDRAVSESAEHLAPWMAWASTPMDVEQRRAWIAEDRRAREAGGDRLYGLWQGGRVVGGCGLHDRIGPGGLEIGYWVHAGFVRRGLATEAVRRLVTIAFDDPAIDRVEIHHDIANAASGHVARAAGFVHVEDHGEAPAAPAETGVERVWRLTRAQLGSASH